MFPPVPIDPDLMEYWRHPTRYKKIKVLAKLDGSNWYDISSYVTEVIINSRLEFFGTATVDEHQLTLANRKHEWCPTVFNDTFDPASGKFNGTTDQAYLQREFEVKASIVILNENGSELAEVPLLWGVKTDLQDRGKTATMRVADRGYIAQRQKLDTDIFYASKKPQEVLTDLLQRAGFSSSDFDFQNITDDTYNIFYIAKRDRSFWRNAAEFVRGIGGKFSVTPEGKFIFRTRVDTSSLPSSSTSPAAQLYETHFSRYSLAVQQRYNALKIEAENYNVESDTKYVVEATLEGDNRIISPHKTATFEFEYISDYATDVFDVITVYYSVGTMVDGSFVPTSIQEGVNFYYSEGVTPEDNNLRLNDYSRYADKAVLLLENKTDAYVAIEKVMIKGRRIFHTSTSKYIVPNQTSEATSEYSFKGYYSNASALERLKDATADEINKKITISVDLNEFFGEIYGGNLVSANIPSLGISAGTFIVTRATHRISKVLWKTQLELLEWAVEYATTAAERKELIRSLAMIWTWSDLMEYLEGREKVQPVFGKMIFGANLFGLDGR